MAESDMRDELQRIADRSSRSNEEARRDAQTAVRKAARRSHWLAGVTITLWLLTAGGIVALLFGYLVLFLPWMSEWGERVAKLTTSTVAASDSDIAVLSHTQADTNQSCRDRGAVRAAERAMTLCVEQEGQGCP